MGRWRQIMVVSLCVAVAFGTGIVVGRRDLLHDDRRGKDGGLFRVQTTKKVVALTFDDGPDPRWTPEVLRLLDRYDAHATFFLIGENAEAHPDLVKDVLADGNQIGNHTFDHPDLDRLPPERIRGEIEDGADAIRKAGAPQPRLFRPPKGLTDVDVDIVAASDKYRTVFWDSCVERFVNHQDIAAGVQDQLRHIRPGSVILAHDGGIPNRHRTMVALPLLLTALKQRGYDVVTVGELLDRTRSSPAETTPSPVT